MAKQESVARIKRRGRSTGAWRLEPKPGTKLRALYDLFQSNKGKPIDVVDLTKVVGNQTGPMIANLKDYYGMDIRSTGDGRTRLVKRNLSRAAQTFVGEWVGKIYIDYMVK